MKKYDQLFKNMQWMHIRAEVWKSCQECENAWTSMQSKHKYAKVEISMHRYARVCQLCTSMAIFALGKMYT